MVTCCVSTRFGFFLIPCFTRKTFSFVSLALAQRCPTQRSGVIAHGGHLLQEDEDAYAPTTRNASRSPLFVLLSHPTVRVALVGPKKGIPDRLTYCPNEELPVNLTLLRLVFALGLAHGSAPVGGSAIEVFTFWLFCFVNDEAP